MTSARALVALLVVVFSVACSNPEKEKVEHVRKGDQYVADKKDEFAVIEYASAVQIDPKYGDAHWKLAQTYERMGNLRGAVPEFIRAADAMPDNREAQVKATELLLLGRRFDDAKSRAAALLQKDPKNAEVRLLQANAMAGAGDTDGAIAQIQEVLKADPANSGAFLSLAGVHQRAGQLKEAEAAYRRALVADQASSGARLALASFLVSSGNAPEGEKVLEQVLAKEPRHLLANRMLAELFMATQRTKEAERPLKVIVEASKESQPRFQLADYYVTMHRAPEAAEILTALAKDPRTFAEAEARLAALEYSQGLTTEAHKRLAALLVRIPNHAQVLTMRAQWLRAENKLDAALESARAATAADPQSADAHLVLARIQDQRGDVSAAIKSYTEVLRFNPRATGAQAALSRLNLASGENENAVRFAEEATRTAPANVEARAALVRSLLSTGDLSRAETEITQLLKSAPNDAEVLTLHGSLYVRRGNTASARRSFEKALEASEGFPEALARLTALDVQAKAPASAIARIEAELAKQPSNILLLASAARAYTSVGDYAKAEGHLRRALAVDPRFTTGYNMLADLYVRQRKLQEARTEYEGIASRDPANVGARTLVGMLFELDGKREEARKVYESIVSGTIESPLAANNLAYIYAEQGVNLDMALQLATSAKPKLPDNANVDDTIGWVYYKKDLASLAVGPLEASLKRSSNDPEVMTHLGLTYAKLGDRTKARDLLTRARSLNASVGGQEVERALASLSQ